MAYPPFFFNSLPYINRIAWNMGGATEPPSLQDALTNPYHHTSDENPLTNDAPSETLSSEPFNPIPSTLAPTEGDISSFPQVTTQWQEPVASPAPCICLSTNGYQCGDYVDGNDQKQVLAHMEKNHKQVLKDLQCPAPGCNQELGDKRALVRHMRNLHYGGGVSCPDCGKKIRSDYTKKHREYCRSGRA